MSTINSYKTKNDCRWGRKGIVDKALAAKVYRKTESVEWWGSACAAGWEGFIVNTLKKWHSDTEIRTFNWLYNK